MNMIRDIIRYIVTASIWGGLIVPLGMIADTSNPNTTHAFIAFFAFAMAVVMTFFIWDGSRIILASMGYYEHDEDKGKNKNHDQNADAALLLLQLLSDDERQDIRQRLIRGNDGELPQIFANTDEVDYSERH